MALTVAEDSLTSAHCIDWTTTTTLVNNKQIYKRCSLEAWHIRSAKVTVNSIL